MYFIICEPEGTGPVNTIVNDLIAAKGRGVTVKVVLEDSKARESRAAFERLKAAGIDIAFDTPAHLLHLKGVSIDCRYLFIGSANLSRAAIEDNYEATILSDSTPDAMAFEQYVATIPLNKGDIFFPAQEGVALSGDFLLSAKGGRCLIENEADSQFDLYLLLCKIQKNSVGANDYSPVTIDYDSIAKELGSIAPVPLGKYRSAHDYYYEHVHRALAKLRSNGLIDYKKGVVTLRLTPSNSLFAKEGGRSDTLAFVKRGSAQPGRVRSEENPGYFVIPLAYWQAGLPAKLSTRAKYIYLISLYEAARSTRYPEWFRSQKDMVRLYGISDTTLSLGFKELEQNHLIAITRDPLNPDNFKDREANVYRMLPIVGVDPSQNAP